MFRSICRIAFLAMVLTVVMLQQGTAAVTTTFDMDREGWTYYVPTGTDNASLYPIANHDPNGYLSAHTSVVNWLFMSPGGPSNPTPDPYGGDWSDLYGGTISFDLYVDGNGPVNTTTHGILIDVPGVTNPYHLGTFFYAGFTLGPLGQWNHYEIEISDTVFSPGPSESSPLSANLDRVDNILINGDWIGGGPETVFLDNVVIAPVPIPGAFLLLVSGLLGIAGFRRFKR